MLVVDTSALISLAVGNALDPTLAEYEVTTTGTVRSELEATAEYDDRHGNAAATVLDAETTLSIVETRSEAFETSRIDSGEASCVAATRAHEAPFLVTDDFRALPEVQELVDADVVLSPIVLRALVERERWTDEQAETAFQKIAEGRDWLGAPIHRYARQLFEP